MVRSVNVHEAKTNLSRLLDEVERGDRVIIVRDGEPISELRVIHRPTLAQAGTTLRAETHLTIAGIDLREPIDEGRR
jgi:antitoxin (DNA-binding transcriptional repressor) of toxin-antitoxin stability system